MKGTADDRERQHVAGRPAVVRERHERHDDRERVHEDALEPAQLAGDEVGDLGEEQAAEGRHRGDDEREPQLVAPHEVAREPQRPADPERGEQRGDEQRHGGDLTHDSERGEGDRHRVRH